MELIDNEALTIVSELTKSYPNFHNHRISKTYDSFRKLSESKKKKQKNCERKEEKNR